MNLYGQVIIGTCIAAAMVLAVFLVLVLRRYLAEWNRARLDERDTAITRSYLQRVSGLKVENQGKWSQNAKLTAIQRILPLLRGGERTRLLQIAELDGVLAQTIRNSHSAYRSERINSIHLLQCFGSEVCIGRLRQLLARDSSPRVRLEAAFALGANSILPPPRETLRLLGALQRQPTRIDIALLRSMAPIYPEQMLLLLEDDLSSPWRARIIDALGWSEHMAVISVLERSADDPDPEIRCAVLRASAKLGHPSAVEAVFSAFRDPVYTVRLQAILASVRLGLRNAVPEIAALCHDEELWVRLNAEQALEQLASDQSDAELRDIAR
jgi:HEAT repeat protein